MGEANTDVKGGKTKTPKKGFIKGLKEKKKKIIWPDKQSTARETTAVIIVSVILGIVIKVFDLIIQFGLDKLIAH